MAMHALFSFAQHQSKSYSINLPLHILSSTEISSMGLLPPAQRYPQWDASPMLRELTWLDESIERVLNAQSPNQYLVLPIFE